MICICYRIFFSNLFVIVNLSYKFSIYIITTIIINILLTIYEKLTNYFFILQGGIGNED